MAKKKTTTRPKPGVGLNASTGLSTGWLQSNGAIVKIHGG
jgi:hypothetical protein